MGWMTVTGAIKLYDGGMKLTDQDIMDMFGHQYLYEDWDKERPSKVLPEGSEGSLRMYINRITDTETLTPTIVTIVGNLRHIYDFAIIDEWLETIYKDKKVFNKINEGSLVVSLGKEIYAYNLETKTKKIIVDNYYDEWNEAHGKGNQSYE